GKHHSSKGKGGKSGGGGSRVGGGGGSGGGGGGGGGGSDGSGGGSGGFDGGGGGSDGGGGGGGGGSGSGGSGSGGGRGGAVQRGGSGGGQRQQQQRRSKNPTPQPLRKWFSQHGVSGGSIRCPYVICTCDRAGQTCGKFHTLHRCFSRLGDAWRAEFGDEAERPHWLELHSSGVDIFALDYDAIFASMYALSVSAEGDFYLCVPPDPGIEAAALGASEYVLPGTAPTEALHTFTLDSGDSHYFFRDSTTLTTLTAPVPVRLADPSRGPVLAHSSTVLSCPAVPSGSLSGLHLPSFSTNLDRERYFLLVVDDYTRYTTVFPLRSKDRGGEFSSDLLRAFCRAEGIRQTFTLPASPQQNGIAERRIGMVMDVARTSMIHAAAPHFLWPFAVQYAAHQINLQPCVSLPETTPTLRWMGKVGDASVFRVWGSRAFVRDNSADKLFSRAVPCVFLGFPPYAPGWQFYHPTSHCVLSSQDARLTNPTEPLEVAVDSGVARDAEPAGSGTGAFCPFSPQQLCEWYARRCRGAARAAGAVGAGGAAGATGGAAGAGGATGGTGAVGGPAGVGAAEGAGAAGPGGARTGGTGAAGAGGASGVGAVGAGAVATGGASGAGAARGTGAGGATGVVAGDPGAEGTGTVSALSGGAARPRPYYVLLLQQVLGLPPSPGPTPPLLSPPPVQSQSQLQPTSPLLGPSPYSGLTRGLRERREPESRPVSPESRPASPKSRSALPVRTVRASRSVSRPRPPPVPGTHSMTLRPSTTPQHVPLPSPSASSLLDGPDPESDSLRAASPTVMRFLATTVTDPLFESTAASALVAELVNFAEACRLDFATSLVVESEAASLCPPSVGGECALGTDVLEDRQKEFECFAAAVPHLVSMLLAPKGDPDAPDIPTPRSYAEAIEGPYSSQWQAAMDIEMASWKSTGTYVDEVPPPGANIVSGMWIFRVKRPPGSPPVFKARYVARGFSQRQGVDFFHNFSPTPKMTTLRVMLHVAAQRDYKLHSLDFSTAFLQGSLHEEIWLPPTWLHWVVSCRTTLAALGFAPSTADPSLFLRTDTTLPPFYVLVYVDDLVFATADTEALAHVKSELQKRHTCTDLGELTSYLGLRITRDRAQRTITLTQSHMVHQVLQRFDFTYSSPQSTPVPTGHSLSAPSLNESVEPSGLYPELVGCLMYLMTCTRPDLAYSLSLLARYVAPVRRRSSQGYTFSLGSGSVSWPSTRPSSVLRSSCEAEIYAGAMAAQELCWLTYLLTDPGEPPRSPPVLYIDNKAILALCQEHSQEHRTKHIALCYFLARELQQRGQLRLAYVASQANTADVFTKALQPCDHRRFCTVLGLDLPVLRLHSDRGGEFSSDLLWDFCRGVGIRSRFRPSHNKMGLLSTALAYSWSFTTPPRAVSSPLRTSHPLPLAEPVKAAVDSGAAIGAESGGAEPKGAEPGGDESKGAESGGVEPRGAEPREWFAQRTCLRSGAAGAGGTGAGGTGAGGAGASSPGGAGVTAGAEGPAGARATGPGGARTRGTGSAGAGGVGGTGAGGAGARGAGAGGARTGGAGAGDTRAGGTGAGGASAGGARARGAGAGGTVQRHPFFDPPKPPSMPPPDSSRPASPVRAVCTGRRVPRPRPPLVPGTHIMALRPSSVPLRVPLPSPPESSLPAVPDPESDLARAASPTVPRLLATIVTDPSFESTAASALVAELVDFAAACRIDYATSLVAESDSDCPPSLGAAVTHLVAMLLAPEGDSDAPDIPTPRSYAEVFTSPYSSKWQTAMDTELASWKSTGTYVDAVPPSEANIVDGMWIFRVKRPPGSPPVFKARYITRGFSQRQGWSLRRPVYGLRQAPCEWHDTLRTTLAALGFAPSTADPSLFPRTDTSLPPFYVDELVFATADTEALALVNSKLQKRHTRTDLGELHSYLGLQITRDRARRTITLTQSHMVHQVLQRFSFLYSSPQSTPLPTGHSLSAPPSDESIEPSGPYPELVGCLITSGMGLLLGGRGPAVLTGHSDASWVDDLAMQRLSQGYTFNLGSGSVSWRSTHSSSVLNSTCEAEIYAGSMAAQELLWLTYVLTDLGERPRSSPVLYVDNKAMIALCQEHRLEHRMKHRMKHIALRYFFARELQQRGQLRLAYVATWANTADIFTKALHSDDHQLFCTVLGLVPTLPHLLTS
ncbi:unnamed protein product, partial [Closterium sp. NIES-53]